MSQQSVLYQWTEEIRKNMPHLSKPQSKALAAFSVGIAKEKGRGLSAAAKKLPFAGNPAAVERRIQRFIASDRIDHAESCRAMAKWVIWNMLEDKPVVLLVDETSLNDRLKAMVVAVAFEGRSIPVAWRRCPNEEWPMGLAELIIKMPRMGSGRHGRPGRRPKGDSDCRQGNRQLAQSDPGDRGLGDVLPDEGDEESSGDDGERRSLPVRRAVGRAGEVLASEG